MLRRKQLTNISTLMQTIRYMLSIPKMIEAANNENDIGFTTLDIIEYTPKDLKSIERQHMLMDIGIKIKRSVRKDNHNPTPSPSTTTINVVPEVIPSLNCCTIQKSDEKNFPV